MHVLTAETGALSLADAGILALLGYGVVFFGLILLMIVVIIIGKCFSAAAARKAAKEASAAPVQSVEESVSQPTAPGSAGGVKLHDVEPKTAAMLMAIVADKLGKPLNELRFISIKEVK